MEYLNNHEGSFQNSHLRIPSTFNHVTQFLYHVKDEDWLHFQNSARDALEGKVQFPVKIKPSSLRLVHKSRAVELVKPLIDEHLAHQDPTSESHRGGGIFHAIQSLFQVVGGFLGGKKVNSFIGGEVEHKKLSLHQRTMARLVQSVYKQKRPEEVGSWTRIDDYDSRYGSIFKNTRGHYTLAVRGTKGNLRDIWKDIKIGFGSKEQRDSDLEKSLEKFHKEHPGSKLNVTSHSLGTMLATNAMKYVKPEQASEEKNDFFLFNPASSPLQSKEAVRSVQDNPTSNVEYFLNKGDIVSNYFSQQLSQEEIEKHVFYGKYSKSPLSSHGLAQWVESY